MYIIDVIPIAKGVSADHLSYYTSKQVKPGHIVRVPLRNKTVTALVVATATAQERKSALRSSDFTMKKASRPTPKRFLDDATIRAAQSAARHFAVAPGRILKAIIPNAILECLPSNQFEPPAKVAPKQTGEQYILQTQPDERRANYKSLIREQFASNHSILFILPTIEDIHKIRNILEKGIEQYTYVLHSNLTKKQLREYWLEIIHADHPVLVIATPAFLSIPTPSLGTIIIEHENATQYKQITAPYLDMRHVAEAIARERGVQLIIGDTLLSIETLWRYEQGQFHECTPVKYRSLTSARTSLVDMREEVGTDTRAGFRILSDELVDRIQYAHEHSERLLIYTSRRGIGSITVCSDCSEPVMCPTCAGPLVLHEPSSKTDTHNFFQCHKCSFMTSAHTTCAHCGGWNLTALGIGCERIAECVRQLVPAERVFTLSRDTARTHKQAKELMESFTTTPGSVLVGTGMTLQYLAEPIEGIAVASFDSLFAIPDFRMNERIIHTLITMRILSQKYLLVQTRQPDQPVLSYGLSGDLLNFYRDEIAMREQFMYPPHAVFIKITRRGKKPTVERDMRRLEEQLGGDTISIYPSSSSTPKRHVMNGLIKLHRHKWVDENLLAYLRSLPPQFIVQVDPADTL